jgi:hypothetical protein
MEDLRSSEGSSDDWTSCDVGDMFVIENNATLADQLPKYNPKIIAILYSPHDTNAKSSRCRET